MCWTINVLMSIDIHLNKKIYLQKLTYLGKYFLILDVPIMNNNKKKIIILAFILNTIIYNEWY